MLRQQFALSIDYSGVRMHIAKGEALPTYAATHLACYAVKVPQHSLYSSQVKNAIVSSPDQFRLSIRVNSRELLDNIQPYWLYLLSGFRKR